MQALSAGFQFSSLKFTVLYDFLVRHLGHWWVAEKLSYAGNCRTCISSGR